MMKGYFLGGPMFSHDPWRGKLFPENARSTDYLRHYSRVLNTVEGNNTFYGLPSDSTVARWREEVPHEFRFCFKFPRAISHEGILVSDDATHAVDNFLQALEPIRDRIGVLLLQLPPHFDGGRLEELSTFLRSLPTDWDYAVEPRHADFFDAAEVEKRFDEMLSERSVSRGIFDTVSLHSTDSDSAAVREAKRKKPQFPERWTVTSDRPYVRFVGGEPLAANAARLQLIVERIAVWIADGKTPFIFLHTPTDDDVPEMCRELHRRLLERTSIDIVGEMPDWPGEVERKQLSLF